LTSEAASQNLALIHGIGYVFSRTFNIYIKICYNIYSVEISQLIKWKHVQNCKTNSEMKLDLMSRKILHVRMFRNYVVQLNSQ
jgi:hypothetical protein